MQVKIDTREKFHAITIQDPVLAANMTEELERCLLPILQKEVKNVVLILKDTSELDDAAAESLVRIQQSFYDDSASFVICELTPEVEKGLEDNGLLELMNVTPTESEAWDIVHLEEVERELLNGPD
ncbi:STAS domain-containing protein [Puia sp.]|jgi:anti-anti-sigma factor|uniref:STAS domain-containing protein n=1 Tax=Puia sp. TaxID=2045100 RepID=UPI002F3E58C0